ncbi:MAG TPA: hypothetical protein VGC42_18110 [Kofleriaceae bacterium]
MKSVFVLIAPALAALSSTAHANPRALPFTYTTDTLPAGGVEVEQYVDLDPLVAQNAITGARQWYVPSAFLTEIEIGIAERLELGLYMTYTPGGGDLVSNKALFPGEGSGLKQRLRYIFANPGEWPVDVGVYGELVESEREVELEGKILLQKRFGNLRIAANVSSEYELYFDHQREYVLNPSAGATYEITPSFHLGLDFWMRGEYPMNPKPASRTFGLGPASYLGPAMMLNFGKLWWAVGVYGRVSDPSHTLQPGEPYGPVYFRSMIGYDL